MPDLNKSDKNKQAGVRYEYLAPNPSDNTANQESTPSESTDIPLADLMSKLKNM